MGENTKKQSITKVPDHFVSDKHLAEYINNTCINQVINHFNNNKIAAMKFLSSMRLTVQKNPKLLECEPTTLVNAFLEAASFELMPSDISGEAYIVGPYDNNKNINGKWVKVKEAQLQIGYLGYVTLMYRAGATKVISEIVYKNDKFSFINNVIMHEPDVFSDDRGEPIGAYAIVKLGTGEEIAKVLNKKEILGIGEKFSRSWKTDFSPWKSQNDPQLWMWRKTVLRQIFKLISKEKNGIEAKARLVEAIAIDDRDSVFANRLGPAMETKMSLTMGNVLKNGKEEKNNEEGEINKNGVAVAESNEDGNKLKKARKGRESVSVDAPIGECDDTVFDEPDIIQD